MTEKSETPVTPSDEVTEGEEVALALEDPTAGELPETEFPEEEFPDDLPQDPEVAVEGDADGETEGVEQE